jgi:hypothetical protein
VNGQAKGITGCEIPGVTGEPAPQLFDYAGRAVDVQVDVPAEKGPKQAVESDQVIDVRMGDENRPDLEQFAHGEGMKVPAVEEQCLAAVSQMNIKGRIAEGPVDQPWEKYRPHTLSLRGNGTAGPAAR